LQQIKLVTALYLANLFNFSYGSESCVNPDKLLIHKRNLSKKKIHAIQA